MKRCCQGLIILLFLILTTGLLLRTFPATAAEKNTGAPKEKERSATLTWDPVTDASGKQPAILAGYKVYYGQMSRSYTRKIDVGRVTTYTVRGLPPGTYYFAVTAYDKKGNESPYSKEVKKHIR